MYPPGATDNPASIELAADHMALVALPHSVVVDTHSEESNFFEIYQIKMRTLLSCGRKGNVPEVNIASKVASHNSHPMEGHAATEAQGLLELFETCS